MRKLRRVLQVITILTRALILPTLLPWCRILPGPIRLRQALEELGGTWVKLGQALALRFDLLPPEYCYELFKLLNEVKPFSFTHVRRIIKEELGGYPDEIFHSFEEQPFAAASIGQVHHAVLRSGKKAAVKVQRPNIREILRTDFELMYLFSGIMDAIHLFGASRSREVIDEFAHSTTQELDYLVEARNAIKLHENSDGDPYERNARVFMEFTTSRVLTSELIEGIPLIEIMYAIGQGNTSYLRGLERQGYDLYVVIEHIDWNMLNQLYVSGVFHADLHPANLFILPGNVIGYVDFGIVGELSNEVRESLTQYTWYLFQEEFERAVAQLMRWLSPSPRTDIEITRQELIRIHENLMFTLKDSKKRETKSAASVFGADVLNIVRRNSMVLSPSVVAYLKTLVTADAIRYELAPKYDLRRITQQFFNRMTWQQAGEWLDLQETMRFAFDSSFRLRRLIDSIESQGQTAEAVESLVQNVQQRVQAIRWRLQLLAFLALAVGTGLFATLINRASDLPGLTPEVNAIWLPVLLMSVFIFLMLSIILQSHRLREESQQASNVRTALRRRWLRSD